MIIWENEDWRIKKHSEGFNANPVFMLFDGKEEISAYIPKDFTDDYERMKTIVDAALVYAKDPSRQNFFGLRDALKGLMK